MQYTYLRLWQILQTLPNYNGPKPPLEALQKVNQSPKKDFQFYYSLEKMLNGPKYFKTNLRSKLYHQLDHVFVFKNDEHLTPQIIDQDVKYIEDLNVPDDCKAVILLNLPPYMFGRNTGELLGPFSVCYDYLRSLSYEIVAVSWNNSSFPPGDRGMNDLFSKIKSQLNQR
ncbi:uncharacterized protein LOC106645823 [Copidosoma floridanum]|uniref:uncharacterized protein LOC106645823 n=1 Tax=Copidosoma floridanum TaxID=29053 RepID=UPI000C6FB456|nr:uncharacterized protein LOC106645823 [Copidosoma floridanum]